MTNAVKYGIGGAVVLAVAALGVVSAKRNSTKPVEVRTEAVESRDLVASVTASGQIQPRTKVDVSADVTGKIVRLDTQTEKISANQSLEYWDTKRIAVARGKALAIKDGRELRADVLTAHLKETKRGALELARMEAFGNVEVATQNEVARAEYGDYDPDTGIANMAGSVKISRGTSQLNGEFAEVNMKTGVSRLLAQPKGAPSGGKRVRGVMQPESKGSPKGAKTAVPQPPAPVNP